MTRDPGLQAFLDASAVALRTACAGPSARVAETVIDRWTVAGTAGGAAERVPVCDWVAVALGRVDPERAALARAFAAVEGRLCWRPRAGAEGAFREGHANAVILGPGGLEARDDLWVGVTVMAPGLRYVDHDHAPEEVYLTLSPGEWWNAAVDWTDPGPGGAVYNPPGIRHAMRSGTGPLLALWYLPL